MLGRSLLRTCSWQVDWHQRADTRVQSCHAWQAEKWPASRPALLFHSNSISLPFPCKQSMANMALALTNLGASVLSAERTRLLLAGFDAHAVAQPLAAYRHQVCGARLCCTGTQR